jgi:choline dehydrogenase-like flavoprotein
VGELLDYARRKGWTVYHATYTCKMAGDWMAVVDDSCACTGSKGLRVVDASVMPTVLRRRPGSVPGCASPARPTADLPLTAISRMWVAFGHSLALPKPQSSISHAIPLMGRKIPLMGVQNSAVLPSSGIG